MNPESLSIVAVVSLTLGIVTAAVVLVIVGDSGHDQHIAVLIAAVAPTVAALLAFLKADQAHRNLKNNNNKKGNNDGRG